jgi:hypothetical protein
MTTQNIESCPKYFSVKAFCERHQLGEGAVRAWIFFNQNKFTEKCIRKVGRKLYVSEDSFFEWMETEGNHHAS